MGSLALPFAAHAAIPFFGPIIPSGSNVCPAGFGLLITVINNIISFALTLAIVFWLPLRIAYAGFLYVINPGDTGNVSKAHGILISTIVGIVVALAAWMIVDALMAVLYNPTAVGGTWSNLVTGGDICLNQAGSTAGAGLNQAPTGVTVTPTPTASGTAFTFNSSSPSGPQSITFNTTQSDADLQAGYNNVANQYSTEINQACTGSFSNCSIVVTALIAQESSGNPTTGCNTEGACGLMQVLGSAGGRTCAATDTSCITSQIQLGLQQLANNYNSFQSISNALAAYNSGATTQAGQSASGLNSAMVASVNCPGLYAWQCPTNPGGLAETQGYVANICRDIALNGGSCN